MAWTEERVKKLTLLWKSGNSASKIAIELGEGVSRNAVIGKIHRLGLSDRGTGLNVSGPKKIKEKIKDKNLSKDEDLKVSQLENISEVSSQRKGKKRGRKPLIKNLTKSENKSIYGSNAIENSSFETGDVDNEIDNIIFYDNPIAKMIPPHEIEEGDLYIKSFKWREDEKPKIGDVVFYFRNKIYLRNE